MEDYLYEEAKDAHRKQQYDSALALLRELYRRNPKRPGLDRALGLTTDKLIEEYVEAGGLRRGAGVVAEPGGGISRPPGRCPLARAVDGARPPRCWPRPARRPTRANGTRRPN